MKKWFGFLCAVALLIGCVFLLTPEAQALTEGGYTYTVSGGNATITKCSNASGEVTVPTTLGGYPVTAIYSAAFQNCTGLTSIIIPDGIISLGGRTFIGCSSLTNVTIGNTVTEIGNYAFQNCSALTTVTIGSSVKTIGTYAFQGCSSLSGIVIPDSVTKIGSYAFNECSGLASLVISSQVTSIEKYTFCGCSKLTIVVIPDGVTFIGPNAFKNCRSIQQITLPASVTTIGTYAFGYCSSLTDVIYIGTEEQWAALEHEMIYGEGDGYEKLLNANVTFVSGDIDPNPYYTYSISNGEVTITDCSASISGEIVIPEEIEGYPVTAIGMAAFDDCYRLTGVTIPQGVTRIADWAFFGCSNLAYVNIPSTVSRIGSNAFKYCSGLQSVVIPAGVAEIDESTFFGCRALTDITIADSVTDIGNNAFYDCTALTNVTYEGTNYQWGLITVGSGNEALLNANFDFEEAKMNGIGIQSDPTKLEYWIGETLDLSGLELVAKWNDGTSEAITQGYTVSGYDATTPGKQTITVTYESFKATFTVTVKTRSVASVTISQLPANLDCWKGKEPDLTGLVLSVNWDDGAKELVTEGYTFSFDSGVIGDQTLLVTYEGKTVAFTMRVKNGDRCGDDLSWVLDDTGTLTITGTGAMTDFANSEAVSWYPLREDVKKVVIGEGVTSIGKYAFSYCSNLTEISIPSGVLEIGGYAFERTHSLQQVQLPSGLQTMGSYLFYRSEGLRSIVIPDSVTSLGASAFSRCVNLKQVTIGAGITKLEKYTFYTCTSLTEITVPNNVTVLGEQVFENCSALTTVTFGRQLTEIGKKSFSGCTALKDVYYDGTDTNWEAITIGESNELLLAANLHAKREIALVVTDQPQNVVAQAGDTVFFTVQAESSGATYKWQYSNDGEKWNNTSLPGYNTNTLTVANVGTGHHGRQYRVIITDANGNKIESEAATLQIPYLKKDSATAFSVPVNTNHVFSVEFSITEGVTYQWQYKGNTSGSTWANTGMTGNKTPKLTVNAIATRNGYQYRCIIKYNGQEIISKAAILYVAAAQPVVVKNPENATAVCGDYATFTIEAQGEGALYHWQWYHEGTDTWVSTYIAGYHTPELKVKTNNFNGGRLYRCRIRTVNGSGWNEVYTEPAMLTVLPAAEIQRQPQSMTVKAGTSVTFYVKAEGEGLTYQWQWAKYPGDWKNTTASGATTDTLTITNVSKEMSGRYYRVIITNKYDGTITTEYAQLFVEE